MILRACGRLGGAGTASGAAGLIAVTGTETNLPLCHGGPKLAEEVRKCALLL